MKLQLGDRKIDLEGAFPLTIGDFKAMKRIGLINPDGEVDASDPGLIAALVHHFAHKVDQTVTEDMIDDLPMTVFDEIGEFFGRMMGASKADGPT